MPPHGSPCRGQAKPTRCSAWSAPPHPSPSNREPTSSWRSVVRHDFLHAQHTPNPLSGRPFLAFFDITTSKTSILIGQNTPGYLEGYRDEAMFQQELYVAATSDNTKIYVADTLNCKLRLVITPFNPTCQTHPNPFKQVTIQTYPGDYTTKSYWLYGTITATGDPLCYGTNNLQYPTQLFPILSSQFFIFQTQDALYQLHHSTKSIQLITRTPLKKIAFVTANDELTLYIRFIDKTVVTATPTASPCPNSYTSKQGGDCIVSCTSNSFVNQSTGQCTQCSTKQCAIGEEDIPCTATTGISTH